jgi:hypothetical protein
MLIYYNYIKYIKFVKLIKTVSKYLLYNDTRHIVRIARKFENKYAHIPKDDIYSECIGPRLDCEKK